MNLRQLRYFVTVVESGSLTKAADQLRIAQPALGLQIRQLECGLATTLLRRHSRGIAPTQTGSILYERALKILRLVAETQREIEAAGAGGPEHVSLGLPPGLMHLVAADLLVRAKQELPRISFHLVEEMSFTLEDEVERGRLDLALCYDTPARPGLLRHAMVREELLLVTRTTAEPNDAPRGMPFHSVPLRAIAEMKLALAGPRDRIRQAVEGAARRLSLPLDLEFEVQSVKAIKELVAHGLAASFLPYGGAADDIRAGRLMARRVHSPSVDLVLYLISPERRPRFRYETALLDFLRSVIASSTLQLGDLARPIDGGADGT